MQAAEVARVAQELAGKTGDWLESATERATKEVRVAVERVAFTGAWGEFFAAAAPGTAAISEALTRNIEAERRQQAQREATEQETQERVQEQERRAHERSRGDDYGF